MSVYLLRNIFQCYNMLLGCDFILCAVVEYQMRFRHDEDWRGFPLAILQNSVCHEASSFLKCPSSQALRGDPAFAFFCQVHQKLDRHASLAMTDPHKVS